LTALVRRLLPALAVLAALVAAAPASAAREVPRGFFGVMADGVLLDRTDAQLAREFELMAANGVEHIRPVLYWSEHQPLAPGSAPPAGFREGRGNVPTRFGRTDTLIELAARHRIRVLPVVLRSPGWAATDPDNPMMTSPPRSSTTYANFMATLIDRYGPRGSFWSEHPDVPYRPQRHWQVWNEPNIDRYWSSPRPFARRYVQLLRVTRRAIKRADRGATVVLAGFANFSWRALRDVYRAGARRHFDLAAVHPFSGRLKNVLKIVRLNRQVMRRYGDRRKRVAVSELTWPSAKGKTRNTVGWETTEGGQAVRLRNAFRSLVRRRRAWRLERITWSTWLTPDARSDNSFDWSGLRKLDPRDPNGEPVDKPALAAFRDVVLPLEGRR
jgi:hypothetical protein